MKNKRVLFFNNMRLLLLFCTLTVHLTLWAGGAPDSIIDKAAVFARSDLAFPDALGGGAYAIGGGKDGRVLWVTSLADDGSEGTLRWALAQPYPRIIQFRVGGTISLQSALVITMDRVTIDGSTAPGNGITLKDGSLIIANVYDVIIRHLRIRPGDEVTTRRGIWQKSNRTDVPHEAIHIENSAFVMMDHCSLTWSLGSMISIINSSFVTVQESLLAESLKDVRGSQETLIVSNGFEVSFIENLFAFFQAVGMQFFSPGRFVIHAGILNNYVYAYGQAGIAFMMGNAPVAYNVQNNVFENPLAQNSVPIKLIPLAEHARNLPISDAKIYISGNRGPMVSSSGVLDEWSLLFSGFTREITDSFRADTELFRTHLKDPLPVPAAQVPNRVINQVGATLPVRDAIDTRIMNQVRLRRGGSIASQSDVGGYLREAETR